MIDKAVEQSEVLQAVGKHTDYVIYSPLTDSDEFLMTGHDFYTFIFGL